MLTSSQQAHKKAIAYYRHSAEDKQENSVAIQRGHTEKFAREHHIEIIHEEADEGKSGLLASRPAFERLFSDWIENPNAPKFDYILVYDVSRWGRFQDQNEAAYYEYECTKKGIQVVYVSRGFPDATNQLISSLETSIQRYMAAEYSRQLSDKVFHGCVKVSEQGYSAGGVAMYGMARQLLDVDKKPIRLLKRGEHKQSANERVTFAPKNDATTETVKKIFQLFVKEHYTLLEIANYLNTNKVPSANGKQWDNSKILKILGNEAYIGTRIYNKRWHRLKQKSRKNQRSEWVIVPNAFEAIIDEETFRKTQERLYWKHASNWRKGINAVKRARKNIEGDIEKWLVSKGLPEFEATDIISELPIIYSVKLTYTENPHWCFVISEHKRTYENALGISVVPDKKKVIDDFFLLPTKDFTNTNFLILHKNNTLYRNSQIESNRIEENIRELIKKFIGSERRYKKKYQGFDW